MVSKVENTKRIAKNTLFLYTRMIVMMAVSLYTFRELLLLLGVDDYGTYNVIGGVVILFSFLSNAINQSNQRFLAYHIGQGNFVELKRTFSMIINVQIVICLTILLLAESIGLWFINSKMNFDGQSMLAVNLVYQCSILTFLIQLFQIPYTSSIISHEKMAFFSYASIGEAFLRLAVVLLLGLFEQNRLILYAIFLTFSTLLILAIYRWYCIRSFNECCYKRCWDKQLFFKLINFSGWNMVGGLGNVGAAQGLNIIFNIFCGVVVNAAMGVSHQVSAAVTSLVSNMQTAFNPQIIKSYANNDIAYFNSLIFRASRLSFYLIFIFAVPLVFSMATILDIWLDDVPDYAVQFTQLTIIYCMVDALAGPLWTANQASGRVKKYMIVVASITLSNLPIAYIILKLGYSPIVVVLVRAIINFIVLNFRILYLQETISFPYKRYYIDVVGRSMLLVLSIMPLYFLMKEFFRTSNEFAQIAQSALIFFVSVLFGFYTLLSINERKFIISKFVTKLRR